MLWPVRLARDAVRDVGGALARAAVSKILDLTLGSQDPNRRGRHH